MGRQWCWCGWEGGGLLLSGLGGLWGHEMSPDLFLPLPVQSRLHQNCSEIIQPLNSSHSPNDTTWCNWPPFGKSGTGCVPLPLRLPRKRLSRTGRAFSQGRPSSRLSVSRLLSDRDDYKELLGAVDNAFLVAYAIGMFIR